MIDIDYEIIDLDHNVGQGLARQIALDVCDDEWVTFVDQDDTLSEIMISAAKKIINDTNCPYVVATKSVIANNDNWINNKEYTVVSSINIDDKNYVYLVDTDKYREYKICEYADDTLEEVVDSDLLRLLITKFNKDLKENLAKIINE